MHRHFADFDAFLTELVQDRIARIEVQGAALRDAAGTGTVVDNLTNALTAVFSSVGSAIVALVISRDGLRARLRQSTQAGVPVLTQATEMISAYLATERELGRISPDADVDILAPMLIGTAHLMFAGLEGGLPEPAVVNTVVKTVIAGVVREPGVREPAV